MKESFSIVFPLFLVIGTGFALRYFEFLNRKDVDLMNRLTFYVALPLLLVASIVDAPGDELAVGMPVLVYVLASIPVLAGVYFATGRLAPAFRGALLVSSFRGNLAYVGFPVIASALGPIALARAAVAVGALTIIVQVVSVVILERLRPRRQAFPLWKQTVEILLNPMILGCAAGFLLRAVPEAYPEVAAKTVQLIGQLALPLALLTLGAAMVGSIRRFTVIGAANAALVKVVVHPALGWIIGFGILRMDFEDLALTVIMLACPTAIVSFSVVKEMQGDTAVCASAITLSTLFSLFSLTVWIALLVG